jgi:hypothetical protein
MARRKNRTEWKGPATGNRMRRHVVRLLKIGWWSVCLVAIATWFVAADPGTAASQVNEPIEQQLLKGVMALIAFPAGLVWVWSLPWLTPGIEAAGVPLSSWPWYTPTVLAWLGCAVLGYVQWFWLMPHVLTLRSSDS